MPNSIVIPDVTICTLYQPSCSTKSQCNYLHKNIATVFKTEKLFSNTPIFLIHIFPLIESKRRKTKPKLGLV